MWATRILAGLTGIVILVVSGCAGTAPSFSPSPVPPVSRTEAFQQEGLRVTLVLDRGTVEAGGGVIRAQATVVNTGPGPISWADLGCFNIYLFDREAPDAPQPPAGKTWPGILGDVKSRTILPFGAKGFLPPAVLEDNGGFSCDNDRRVAELPGLGSMSIDMVWLAQMVHRLPAPAGEYRAIFQFPFLGRMSSDRFTGDLVIDIRWVRVGVPFAVVGEAFSGIAPTTAVDRALEDVRVSGWLAGLKQDELRRVGIVLMDQRWLFIVDTRRGELRVEIDPTDGSILSVQIPG